MKKLTAIILAMVLIIPVAASASVCVSDAYILFIDADKYNREYNAGFDFDSAIFELVFESDGKTVYYCRQMWKKGVHTSTDFIECSLSSEGDSFTVSFPDGTVFRGYYDPNQNGVWLTLGGNSYFRFLPVQRYDISVDYKK